MPTKGNGARVDSVGAIPDLVGNRTGADQRSVAGARVAIVAFVALGILALLAGYYSGISQTRVTKTVTVDRWVVQFEDVYARVRFATTIDGWGYRVTLNLTNLGGDDAVIKDVTFELGFRPSDRFDSSQWKGSVSVTVGGKALDPDDFSTYCFLPRKESVDMVIDMPSNVVSSGQAVGVLIHTVAGREARVAFLLPERPSG